MAASIAGVFWRAARPSELAYGHTRTHPALEKHPVIPRSPPQGGRRAYEIVVTYQNSYSVPSTPWHARNRANNNFFRRRCARELLYFCTLRSNLAIFRALPANLPRPFGADSCSAPGPWPSRPPAPLYRTARRTWWAPRGVTPACSN